MFDNIMKGNNRNFLFVGETGSGKSEVAINFAKRLASRADRPVHFFDMDMTKPLFRSRDFDEQLKGLGIEFHYQEQFMDAPTLVGGVSRYLKDWDCYVVMDVGGDDIGARAVGGFAPIINSQGTMVYYVINSYRPWSYDIEHIDQILMGILGVSHIRIGKLHVISNPNLGHDTKAADVISGHQQLAEMIGCYKPIDFACVRETLYRDVTAVIQIPMMPLHIHLRYPWLDDGW